MQDSKRRRDDDNRASGGRVRREFDVSLDNQKKFLIFSLRAM